MNQKIRALMVQAITESYNLNDDPDGDIEKMYIPNVFAEKFAELILAECFYCINVMEKIADSTNADIPVEYNKATYIDTLDTVRKLLKVHFGVE